MPILRFKVTFWYVVVEFIQFHGGTMSDGIASPRFLVRKSAKKLFYQITIDYFH